MDNVQDNVYPTKAGGTRRINWGWAQVPPQSAQTLPREVTFNAAARTLQQYPIEELKALRGDAAVKRTGLALKPSAPSDLGHASGVAQQSEIVVSFELPSSNATFGVSINGTMCAVDFSPPPSADDGRHVKMPTRSMASHGERA